MKGEGIDAERPGLTHCPEHTSVFHVMLCLCHALGIHIYLCIHCEGAVAIYKLLYSFFPCSYILFLLLHHYLPYQHRPLAPVGTELSIPAHALLLLQVVAPAYKAQAKRKSTKTVRENGVCFKDHIE